MNRYQMGSIHWRFKVAIADKYPMAFISLEEWVEKMLNELSVDIEDILQFVKVGYHDAKYVNLKPI